MPWVETVNPDDDKFHPRNDDPYWNESHLTTFVNPERNLMGTLYYYFRPNMGLAVGGPIIWNGDGEDVYNCLHYAWDANMAMPEGTDMNDFSLPNGLSVKTVELQKQYHMTYEGHEGCEIDLVYTAQMEPHYMQMEGMSTNPGIIDWMTSGDMAGYEMGHYEQPGWMKGTVKVRGETYEIDYGCLRDHTWGPRKQISNMRRLRGAWPFCAPSPDTGFQAYAMQEAPIEEDPVFGTTERVTSGWYLKDGVKGSLVSGTRRCVERGDDGRPVREILEAKDDLGRDLYAEGTMQNWIQFPCYTDCFPMWGITKWEYDGREEYGENMDYLYVSHYRRMWEQLAGRKQPVPVG